MTNFKLNDNTTIPGIGFGVFMVPNNGPTEEAVTTALKEGYRLIDTAAAYQNESDVGKAVKKSGIPREEIYVTSKLWLQDYGYEAAKKAIDTSLSKLGLDYMDLYLLHQPYGDTAGAWKALEEAVKAGKIRSIGVSNHTVRFLDKLLPNMKILPVVNQMECNPYFQQKELREYLAKYKIRMEAWYPLGHANRQLLTDKVLVEIAETYGKSVAQIILRWHYQEDIIALPKATSIEHIRDNISIFDFALTDEDMTAIRALDKGKGTHDPDNMANAVTLGMYHIH